MQRNCVGFGGIIMTTSTGGCLSAGWSSMTCQHATCTNRELWRHDADTGWWERADLKLYCFPHTGTRVRPGDRRRKAESFHQRRNLEATVYPDRRKWTKHLRSRERRAGWTRTYVRSPDCMPLQLVRRKRQSLLRHVHDLTTMTFCSLLHLLIFVPWISGNCAVNHWQVPKFFCTPKKLQTANTIFFGPQNSQIKVINTANPFPYVQIFLNWKKTKGNVCPDDSHYWILAITYLIDDDASVITSLILTTSQSKDAIVLRKPIFSMLGEQPPTLHLSKNSK